MTAAAIDDRAKKRVAFRWIALGFVLLLALGFSLAIVVYERFVAYRAVAGQHVPKGALFVARFDLTHVMLYEPFRRYVFPLVELGGEGRRERLGDEGFQVGGEVREVVVALGAEASEWTVILGGPLVDEEVSNALAKVLRAENRRIDERSGVFSVDGGRVIFGQARDGALLLSSSEPRLRSAFRTSPQPEPLGQGAGGLWASGPWLPPELKRLEASYRAGSVLVIDISAEIASGISASAARTALEGLLARTAGLDPALLAASKSAVIHTKSGRVEAEISLSNTAVERLVSRALGELGLSAGEAGEREVHVR